MPIGYLFDRLVVDLDENISLFDDEEQSTRIFLLEYHFIFRCFVELHLLDQLGLITRRKTREEKVSFNDFFDDCNVECIDSLGFKMNIFKQFYFS